MATAKKAAPKAATKPVKTAPAKAVKVVAKPAAKAAAKPVAKPAAKPVAAKPVAKKAVVSKTAKARTDTKHAELRPGVIKLEKRIATLRDQLGITGGQRKAWRNLATVMRENESAMYTVVTRRAGRIKSVNGPENLRLYGLIAAVHAANIQRLLGAFQPLYDSFSVPQKKIADKLLRDTREGAFSDGY